MVELKTIISDISNDYILPPNQSKQLLGIILQKINNTIEPESIDFTQCQME